MNQRVPLWLQTGAFIAGRTVINTVQRMVYPFLPVFARGLGVELTTMAWVISLRSSTGLLGPLLASISDARGRKTGMLAGMGLMAFATGLVAIWPTFPAFVAMLILSIMASFIFIPAVHAFIGDRVPYQRRGLVMALIEFGWSFSFIFGMPLVGWLMGRAGWQAPFVWISALCVLMMLVLWLLVPADAPLPADRPNLWRNLGVVARHPMAWAGIGMALAMCSANELINLIFGVWLEDSFAVQIGALAAASAVIGLSELGGEALVSVFVDRLGKRRATALGLIGNALAALALPMLGGSLTSAFIGLFLFYITFEFTMVSSLPLMTEVVPAARATFMAAYIASTAVARAFGSLAAPRLYQLGQSWPDVSPLLATVIAAALLDGLALLALRRIREQKLV